VLIAALDEIRARTRAHALTQKSAAELEDVEALVRAWRQAHPGPVVVEFIRFEAFAKHIAASMGAPRNLGGLFGRITGGAHSLELRGARALFLASRWPRLAEWHAEAGAVATEPELIAVLAQLEPAGRPVKSMATSSQTLERSVAALSTQLDQLNTATQPDAWRPFSGETLGLIAKQGRSLILLAALCVAALLILHAVLRRDRRD